MVSSQRILQLCNLEMLETEINGATSLTASKN